ncbi:MAG: hypothetical protein R2764_05505 [Bacteroidales bacterium]
MKYAVRSLKVTATVQHKNTCCIINLNGTKIQVKANNVQFKMNTWMGSSQRFYSGLLLVDNFNWGCIDINGGNDHYLFNIANSQGLMVEVHWLKGIKNSLF